ncbi:MAG: T9SS type A sorting domain-containing protein [Bacteroidetes bacterium]|nr:T9SS type A sorting domain-containing protein [Bacteroidota bacterium]
MNARTLPCSLALSILLLCLFAPLFSTAQGTPQYSKKQSYVAFVSGWAYFPSDPADTPARGRRLQWLYNDIDFSPKPISGTIKNIYFWARGAHTLNVKTTLYNVEIKMGYTQQDSFKRITSTTYGVRDTFITGLTTVFQADSVTVDYLNTWAYWWKFPLMGNGFHYNASPEQNLVVEFSFGLPKPNGWVVFTDSNGTSTNSNMRFLSGYRDSTALQHWPGKNDYLVGSAGGNVAFGFDVDASSVPNIGSQVDMQLYPNPTSGKLQLRIQAAKVLQDVVLSVSDLNGRRVWYKQIHTLPQRYAEEIDLSGAPSGTYFVEIGLESGVVRRKFTKL